MGLAALIFTAIGLSMDAFAASICQGLRMPKLRWGRLVVIGLYFGAFQALMPLLGWRLGIAFSAYIRAFDHWAAFLLLVLLGGKMLWDSLRADADAAEIETAVQNHRELLLLAVATSIDALAVGVAFACLDVVIFRSVALIGGITCIISWLGVWIGSRFGRHFHRFAGIFGGIILILIAAKILLTHTLAHA